MKRRRLALLLVAALVEIPASADAELRLGADASAVRLLGEAMNQHALGIGVDVRAGAVLPTALPPATLELGGKASYARFARTSRFAPTPIDDGELQLVQALLGGRLGQGRQLRPWAELYGGLAHVVATDAAGTSYSDQTIAVLAGLGLDVVLGRVAVGLHVRTGRLFLDSPWVPAYLVAAGAGLTASF